MKMWLAWLFVLAPEDRVWAVTEERTGRSDGLADIGKWL